MTGWAVMNWAVANWVVAGRPACERGTADQAARVRCTTGGRTTGGRPGRAGRSMGGRRRVGLRDVGCRHGERDGSNGFWTVRDGDSIRMYLGSAAATRPLWATKGHIPHAWRRWMCPSFLGPDGGSGEGANALEPSTTSLQGIVLQQFLHHVAAQQAAEDAVDVQFGGRHGEGGEVGVVRAQAVARR